MLLMLLLLCLIDSFCFLTKMLVNLSLKFRLSVSMSLGAGQIIFLAGINATENKVSGLSFYPWNELTRCTVNVLSKGAR